MLTTRSTHSAFDPPRLEPSNGTHGIREIFRYASVCARYIAREAEGNRSSEGWPNQTKKQGQAQRVCELLLRLRVTTNDAAAQGAAPRNGRARFAPHKDAGAYVGLLIIF